MKVGNEERKIYYFALPLEDSFTFPLPPRVLASLYGTALRGLLLTLTAAKFPFAVRRGGKFSSDL